MREGAKSLIAMNVREIGKRELESANIRQLVTEFAERVAEKWEGARWGHGVKKGLI